MALKTRAFFLGYVISLVNGALTAVGSQGSDVTITFKHDDAVLLNTIDTGSTSDTAPPIEPITSQIDTKRDDLYASSHSRVHWAHESPDVFKVNVERRGKGNVSLTFDFQHEDRFYGAWEYPWDGRLDNQNVRYNTEGIFDTRVGINWANAHAPFFFSQSGWGIYIDSPDFGWFEFTKSDSVRAVFNQSQEISYFVIYNSDMREMLTTFTGLSSRISMPPDFAYGPAFWSDDLNEDFHGKVTNAAENQLDITNNLVANRIRAGGLIVDRPYGTGNMSYGNFDFNKTGFPDPEGWMQELRERGYESTIWVANRAWLGTELYNISLENDWFYPGYDGENTDGPALNLSIPEAYAYLRDKLSIFPETGFKGYKIDRGEELEMPVPVENPQMVLFEQLCHETMVRVWGEGNSYSFARNSFDRSRRLDAVWNGDSHANFTGLRYTITSSLRAGLLGWAQWGSDTGGYIRDEESPSLEVFARWMFFSAFSPMYEVLVGRSHTPWYDYPQELMTVLKKTTDLHVRLTPHIRSYIHASTQNGLPLNRALFLDYQDDESVWDIADEYSFGREILVAPVYSEDGNRSVYFPKGDTKFLDFWDKQNVYEPGQTLTLEELPLDTMPVYVAEGAIIPTGDLVQGNAKWIKGWKPYLEVEIYPSYNVQESSYTYYRGEESGSSGKGTTTILVKTNGKARTVTVEYGDLGVKATLVVYTRQGTKKINMPRTKERRTLKVSHVETLFA